MHESDPSVDKLLLLHYLSLQLFIDLKIRPYYSTLGVIPVTLSSISISHANRVIIVS